MAELRTFIVPLPVLDLLNANQGLHYRVKAKRTKAIREAAALMARSLGVPPLQRARIFAEYLPTDGRRRDPANWAPSAKAAVDGLVDARVLPDDDDTHLIGPDMRLGALAPLVNGQRRGRLLLRILELPSDLDDHQPPIPQGERSECQ
jgi:crossover junction endodeoxyribonuclease RusA